MPPPDKPLPATTDTLLCATCSSATNPLVLSCAMTLLYKLAKSDESIFRVLVEAIVPPPDKPVPVAIETLV